MDNLEFRLRVYLLVLIGVMAIGTIGFMRAENLSLIDAIYFSIVTVATVGYGDIHPTTDAGKILAIVLIVTGVGTFLGVIASATEILLNKQQKQIRLQKLHMVIGLFFSEIGNRLLGYFSQFDPNAREFATELMVTNDWVEQNFRAVSQRLEKYPYTIDPDKAQLDKLRQFLEGRGNLLLRLLENPSLLERESFTELLRAVFHLREELLSRNDLQRLPKADQAHLAGDIRRAYILLLRHWMDYMKYLKDHYPYLFSLAARTNPFNSEASAVVE